MTNKLFVGNLPHEMTENELQEIFAEVGPVVSAKIITDRMTGLPRGFGFVEMGSDEEAQAAIAALNGKDQGGRPLTVNEAKPREDRGGGCAGDPAGGAVLGG